MRIRNAVAASAAVIALVALGLLGTADAGPDEKPSNTFTVEKVVVGPVPEGAVFEVEVTCESIQYGTDAAAQLVPEPVTVKFDASGLPLGSNMVAIGPGAECTATETVTNGATVTYECEASAPAGDGAVPNGNGDFVECLDDQTVHFGMVVRAEGTITVTNTFEEEPPPPAVEPAAAAPAGVVAATPTFTG
jgi:hypothetical protein